MRLHNLAALFMSLIAIPASAEEAKLELKTQEEKFSYAIGLDIVSSLDQLQKDFTLNKDILVRGIQDALSNKAQLTKEEVAKIKIEFEQAVRAKIQAKVEEAGEVNKTQGEEFLAKNKTRPEVKTTASGLQYEVLTEGTGVQPKLTDTVTVHYRGTLLNGDEFDSSYARNEPATFPLNHVIKGWQEGVQLMNIGSKYKFYIPSDLAYGKMGAAPKIGPNSTLIFEVELISIASK